MSRTPVLTLLRGSFGLSLEVGAIAADRIWTLPGIAPPAGQVLKTNDTNPNILEWAPYVASTGSSGVTSVGITLPTALFVESTATVTSAGNLQVALSPQAANRVFAGPVGGASSSTPVFRTLVAADIPDLDGAKITGSIAYARLPVGTGQNTVAAGDDTRFHSQNTDTATNSEYFQVDSGNNGVRLTNIGSGATAALHVRDNGGTNGAALVARDVTVTGDLIVQGTTTTVNQQELQVGDALITLNYGATGTVPDTLNSGIEVFLGAGLTPAQLYFNKGQGQFFAGTDTKEQVARIKRQNITAAEIATQANANRYTWNTGLNTGIVIHQLRDDQGNEIDMRPKINANGQIVYDFSNVTVNGTWQAIAVG